MKKSFTDLYINALNKKCIEPEPRMHGGYFGYVSHKYPIKGGISRADVMIKQMEKKNALFQKLMKK